MNEQGLLARIDADLLEAMRARDETRKLALRSVKAALTEAEKAGESSHTLSDEEALDVLGRVAKQRRDAIVEFTKAGRSDLVQKEEAELAVLEDYLPAQMDEAEVEAIVREVIAETGAESVADMKRVMPVAMARTSGRADGRLVNQVARRLLG